MNHAILIHKPEDDVGVAVRNIKAGEVVGAVTLEGCNLGSITVVEDIALGHKIALRGLARNKHVIEYGRPIGRATKDIVKGAQVHVHNLKSLRW
jgi:(2R)-sulfolactate sulfo-lyase subunit alpha